MPVVFPYLLPSGSKSPVQKIGYFSPGNDIFVIHHIEESDVALAFHPGCHNVRMCLHQPLLL